MKRLSSPLASLKPHYTVVVVGSGYGGSIAASRLARTGQSVCLLERGREIIPGEYPDSELEALREFQVDLPTGHQGNPTGLYDFRVNRDLNVFIGCGLGGTSLVNANVALEPDKRIFEDLRWPAQLRNDKALVNSGFDRAMAMLGAGPYPQSAPVLKKYQALVASAKHLQAPVSHPPIAVSFTDGPSASGVAQRACTLCGDCVSGCNVGAKNTVLMNYLPDARAHGAELFTGIAVRRISREGTHWVVHFKTLQTGREVFDAPDQAIHADHVILSAGTLGSTEILLRSAATGLGLSDQLGHHFSGNGDVLGFAYNTDSPIHGVGRGRLAQDPQAPVGPTITGVIDLRNPSDLEAGAVIEEGALPGPLAGIMPAMLMLAAKAMGKDTDTGIADNLGEQQREVESLLQGAYKGATDHTQTFLVMAHDDGKGQLVLENDRLRIHWPGVGRQERFSRINKMLLEATRPLGGTYVANPVWHPVLGQDLITVHPLGGCAMAEKAENGVVNHAGQVFNSSAGEAVHSGLYVMDGAIMPRSLGVNPLLTISAVAERNVELLARREGWSIDWSSKPRPLPDADDEKPGLRFTERMAGSFFVGAIDSFVEAEERAKAIDSTGNFVLTMITDDLETMLVSEPHRADLVGTLTIPGLSPEPLHVSEGVFELLKEDPGRIGAKQMSYRLQATSVAGDHYFFEGIKEIHQERGFDLWDDTTTLFVTLYQKKNNNKIIIGKGIFRIAPSDLQLQLSTIEVTRVVDPVQRLVLLARFGNFFVGSLFDVYGGVSARPSVFSPDAPPRKRRLLRLPAPQVYTCTTPDGTDIQLTRYPGGAKGPLLLAHGLGVSSRIFTLDTIETNLSEYLHAQGYDLWLLDYRSSIESPAALDQYTGDDIAQQDYPVAVARILKETNKESLQAIVHCFGSTTFIMAMLSGLKGVRSAVCSQVATHVSSPALTRIKAGLHLPEIMQMLGVDSLTAYTDDHAGWRDQLFNQLVKLQPTAFEEQCRSPVCHRISFLYGLLYEHDQINLATHAALHELFGVASIAALEHLALMVRKGRVVAADGSDKYLPHLQKLAIPITFLHGAENSCYNPESTVLAYEALRQVNGDLYQRHLINGYGHIDCIFGANSVRDVYPLILNHLEKHVKSDEGR